MPSVKEFTLCVYALNEEETFSEGDHVCGEVTLGLEKETKIESLFVKAKGDAKVHWSEKHGDKTYTYSEHRRLFKEKQFLIAEQEKDTVLPYGVHRFKFRLQMPQQSMPSSFRGTHGKVVYTIEAKLSRSWRLDKEVTKEICFWSKSVCNVNHLMAPQRGSTSKELGVFSRGSVQMDATVDRGVYSPGDTVSIVVDVNNSSSKSIIPKFSLVRSVVCRARGHTKQDQDAICKRLEGNVINSQTHKEVRCSLQIPSDTGLSIDNFDILSVFYHIKVYLDISFSFDPEVLFPVVIAPRRSSQKPVNISVTPTPPGPMWGQSSNDLHLPGTIPYPPSPSSCAPMYPPLPPQNPASPTTHPPRSPKYPASPTTHPPRSPQYPSSPTTHPPIPSQYPASPSMHPPMPPQFPASPTKYPPQPGQFNPIPQPQPYAPPSPSSTPLPPPSPKSEISSPPTYNVSDNGVPSSPICPTAPVFPIFDSVLPSAPLMTADFLSSEDDKPPSYQIVFPSSFESGADADSEGKK